MAKIDWSAVELAFINSHKSLKEIAEEFGVGYGNVRKRASDYNWQEKRNTSSQSVTKKVQEIAEETRVMQLEKFTQLDLDRVSALQSKMKLLIDEIEKPMDLRVLAASLKDLQSVYRLALGASTENQATGSVKSFDEWVKEQLDDIDQQKSVGN